ncbi:HAD family hydrolase [Paenibacillus sp. GCM10012307]|uniref:HAD-IA family hydrolase n=1 Tax=Paenibacillus roseus TaxID=2798579 RepID=A0A934MP67_9BACL|nr:HAD-IA family hydrolase [Paenibacillus roseus]MBJ6360114.1 HAD-IA family hydrolase [Paenibacillus roseus]
MNKSYAWFDLGYTLVYLPREQGFQQWLQEKGIHRDIGQIERAYHLTDKLFMRQYPGVLGKAQETFFPWYLGLLNYELGVHVGLHEQHQRLTAIGKEQGHDWRAFPFTVQVLQELKRRSIGIGLISNWDHTARRVLDENGLTPFFDHIVISSEAGEEKPSRKIFDYSLRLAGVTPSECIYVGDNYYDDVAGSAKAGLDSILVNRFGRLGIEEIQHDLTVHSIEEIPSLLTSAYRRRSL